MTLRPEADQALEAAGENISVVVAGTGVAGLACALALARDGCRITLLGEPPQASGPERGARVLALNRTARRFLTELGAWERVAGSGVCAYRGISVWSGAGRLDFDAGDVHAETLGCIASDNDVCRALYEQLEPLPGVDPCREMLAGVERRGGTWEVRTDKGSVFNADLLVGADGANSRVRTLLGVETEYTCYNQAAVTAALRIPKDEAGGGMRCRQCFFEEGVLAFLPLDDTTVSVVWSCRMPRAMELKTMPEDGFTGIIARTFGLPASELALTSERAAFPVRGVRARRFVLPGAVLVGDAAHAVHPMAGLGANLGLADVRTLASMLARRQGRWYAAWPVLCRYQREVMRRHCELQVLLDGLDTLFAPQKSMTVSILREMGLSGVNRCARLRSWFTRRALDLA